MTKKSVLLINLGTPDNCDNKSVYRYLKEFLNDPRVIDIPAILRWILVNLLIVPLRHRKSAAAYKKIWLQNGSPLFIYSEQLKNALSRELDSDYQVELAMRYGSPAIKAVLQKLQHCEQLIIIPLFPQYSSAATGSALEEALSIIKARWNIPAIHTVKDFYSDIGFITSYAEIIKQTLQDKEIDYLLFSYHGLPERHITKSNCQARCDRLNSCPEVDGSSRYCYRAQCYETSRLITKQLNMDEKRYGVAFQSRLGRTPWIKPYTDLLLPDLIKKGVKRIAIVCPSFVADCLETLEEVNIRAREQWLQLGGEEFTFVPCLNGYSLWAKRLAELVKAKMVE